MVCTVKRLLLLLVVAGLLPACSSSMTRFDYPVMGMGEREDASDKRSYEGDYARNDYSRDEYARKTTYQKNSLENRYDRSYSRKGYDDGRDYSRTYKDSYRPQGRDKRYGGRDVYDTASTDHQDKKSARYETAKDEIDRGQLPDLTPKRRADRVDDQSPRKELKEQRYAGDLNRKPAYKDVGGRHVVEEGDTLYNISRRYNVTTDEVRRANGLYGNDIKLGQHLKIPGLGKGNSRVVYNEAKVGRDGTYKVKKGDTVYNISRRFGVSRDELAEANGISDMTQVQLGQKLIIPGQGKKTPVQVASIDKKAGVKALGDKGSVIRRKKTVKKSANKIKPVDSGARAKLSSKGGFLWPARGKILSGFGRQKSGTINDGVNLALPQGTLIKAAGDGVVAYAGSELKGYGHLILIRHANNWVTAYAHNSKLLVKRGQKVRRGQPIAKSGKSGSVVQPQLHFELRKGSKPVNPIKHLAMR